MDATPFTFGNAATDAASGVVDAMRERRKAANDAVALRLKTGLDGTKTALELVDKIQDPAVKAKLLNGAVVPMVKMITGYDAGTITPEMFSDPKTEAVINTATQLTNDYLNQTPQSGTKKPMALNEYKMKLGMLMAASKQANERLKPEQEIMDQMANSIKQNVPGPGNTDTTGVVDPVQGTVTPLTNTATGQPTTTGPKPPNPKEVNPNVQRASLESGIARDEKTLQALVNPPKGKAGLPNVSGNWLANLTRGGKAPKWSDYSQQEQTQLALAQSTAQRLTANLASVNQLRSDQGLEPIPMSPSVAAVAAHLSQIQGVPQNAGAVQPQGQNHTVVNSQAEYDALPVGATFIDSTGKPTVKRGK